MAFHDQGWTNSARSNTWEQSTPPARSGASSVHTNREDQHEGAFVYQFEEIDRALDNLVKSGKYFGGGPPRPGPPVGLPMSGIPRGPYGGFAAPIGSRPGSIDFDPMRSQSASNLRNFYASQRYQGPPAGNFGGGDENYTYGFGGGKRRGAAARERDLRNWHQEQQMNRGSQTGMNPDASNYAQDGSVTSGGTQEFETPTRQGAQGFANGNPMTGHDMQHNQNGFGSRQPSHGGPAAPGLNAHRGASPFDAFHMAGSGHLPGMPSGMNIGETGRPLGKVESNGQSSTGPTQQAGQPLNRAPSTSASPAPNGNGQNTVGRITSASGTSSVPAIAPIGSRPVTNPSITKRATTPLASPMTQSFTSNSGTNGAADTGLGNDRKENEKRGNTTPAPQPGSGNNAQSNSNGVSNAWASGKPGANIWGPPPKGGVGSGAQGNVWG